MNVDDCKAILVQYADSVPAPTRKRRVARPTVPQVSSIMELESSEITKLKSLRRRAEEDYELYTPDEKHTILSAASLIDLYNMLRPLPLWQCAAATGAIRINSQQFRERQK